MKMRKTFLLVGLLIIMTCVLGACSSEDGGEASDPGKEVSKVEDSEKEVSKEGGVYTMAGVAIPHLDPNRTTMGEMRILSVNVYEGLYELDGKYEAQPALATSLDVSEDDTTYTFTLRGGVKFHDGSEMTSEDVVASFDYWAKYNNQAWNMKDLLEDFGANGDYEFYVKLKEPYAPFLNQIANDNQKMIVYPLESLADVGDDVFVKSAIGTGPYQVEEWIPDQYLMLEKFSEYTPFTEVPSSGYAGEKVAYVDKIKYEIISDESTIVAGIQTNVVDYGGELAADSVTALKEDSKVNIVFGEYDTQIVFSFNCGNAPFNNIKVRQAAVSAMDIEEQAIGARGSDSSFWEIDGSFVGPESVWYIPNTGIGIYNSQDIEKAKKLLDEAGYDGTPIKILYVSSNSEYSNIAQVLKTQFEKAGFNVELTPFDRPTVNEKRGTLDGWDLHICSWYVYEYDPMVFGAWVNRNGWISNWDDEDAKITEEIFHRLSTTIDFETRYQIFKEWQSEFLRTAPYAKGYAFRSIFILNPRVQDYWANTEERFPRYMGYNLWLK